MEIGNWGIEEQSKMRTVLELKVQVKVSHAESRGSWSEERGR
jgi:hypothetical protein